MKNQKSKAMTKKLIEISSVGVILFFMLGILIMANRTIAIHSDSSGVKFVTDGERISEITIQGPFPYNSIVPDSEKRILTDAGGRITGEIETYNLKAEFSWFMCQNLKIKVEISKDFTHTYILNFADKVITIVDGREQVTK